MNKSTAAFLGIDPATQMVDEIEFVIGAPLDEFVSRIHGDLGFSYTPELEKAVRFVSAESAARAIRQRNTDVPELPKRFVIVPVKVKRIPAVFKTIEAEPASTVVELY